MPRKAAEVVSAMVSGSWCRAKKFAAPLSNVDP